MISKPFSYGRWVAALVLLFFSPAVFSQETPTLAGRIVSVTGKVMIRQESGANAKNLRAALPGKEVFVGDVISTPSDGKIKLLLQDRSLMDIGPSSLFKLDQMKLASAGERQVDSTIAYGTVRAGVTQKLEGRGHFKVRTSSATMGVRGTEFIVKSEISDIKQINRLFDSKPGEIPRLSFSGADKIDSKTEVTVLQGKVEVGTHPSVAPSQGLPDGRQPSSMAAPAVLLPGMQLTTAPISASSQERLAHGAAPAEIKTLEPQKMAEVTQSARPPDTTFAQEIKISGTTKEEESQQRREERRPSATESPAGQPSREEPVHTPASSSAVALIAAVGTAMADSGRQTQTIRMADLIPGATSSTAILQNAPRQPPRPSLIIKFTAPTATVSGGR